jgi:hypothetical protein
MPHFLKKKPRILKKKNLVTIAGIALMAAELMFSKITNTKNENYVKQNFGGQLLWETLSTHGTNATSISINGH